MGAVSILARTIAGLHSYSSCCTAANARHSLPTVLASAGRQNSIKTHHLYRHLLFSTQYVLTLKATHIAVAASAATSRRRYTWQFRAAGPLSATTNHHALLASSMPPAMPHQAKLAFVSRSSPFCRYGHKHDKIIT
jgi:hypothetical protein